MDNELKIAGLNYSQEAIKRMAANSFYIKGWCISILTIAVTLLKKDYAGQYSNYLSYALVISTLLFWVLDAHYLAIERKLRNEYRSKVQLLDNDIKPFMVILSGHDANESFLSAFTSKTILPIYITIIITITVTSGVLC